MSVGVWLEALRARDVRLWLEDGRLMFDAPAGELTPEEQEELRSSKPLIIEYLESAPWAGGGEQTVFAAETFEDKQVPSYAQERLWFIDRLEPGATQSNIGDAQLIRGPLSTSAFRNAVNSVIARHEALRTVFCFRERVPACRILDELTLDIDTIEIAPHDGVDALAQAKQQATEDHLFRFDLEQGPLLRVTLFRLGAELHVAALTLHHIIGDAGSLEIFWRDVGEFYAAEIEDSSPAIPALPVQFGDFARWERSLAGHGRTSESRDYWKQRLASVQALQLPLKQPRPSVPQFHGAKVTGALPASSRTALHSLAVTHSATPFICLVTVFAALLRRYSGQVDLTIGTPVETRRLPELQGLIGPLINNLVIRFDMSGNPSFHDLLRKASSDIYADYEHQNYPFQKLVEDLEQGRDLSRSPLFQIAFSYQSETSDILTLGPLTGERLEREVSQVRYDLELHVSDSDDRGLQVALLYDTELFTQAFVEQLLEHYLRLIERVAEDPALPVFTLPLLSLEEQKQVLERWNDTARAYPGRSTVQSVIEETVKAHPSSVAVSSADGSVTYGELAQRAKYLMALLVDNGVGPGDLVAVCATRCIDMVAGLVGIFNAGAAYVPLDPDYPDERLNFMLEDCSIGVLLTDSGHTGRFDRFTGTILLLDELHESDNWEKALPDAEVHQGSPDDLAYVIYTSGSTGQPKGVEVTHANLLNLVCWHREVYGLSPDDRCSQVAGLAFDATVWEVWPCLTAGARLVLIDEGVRRDPGKLWDWMRAEAITVSFLPTPLAEAALRSPVPDGLALRYLLTGGDVLHSGLANDLPFRLVNHYGPTENTVVSTSAVIDPGDERLPPIGKPIHNVRAYVLDEQMCLVPPGVEGELYVGGASVARGYWRRPELTASRFLDDPFVSAPGARMYRTGDIVRFRDDGSLEFCGRADGQIKIRGFRVEPGEIEQTLQAHPGIEQAAVVLAQRDETGFQQLVAYLVPAAGDTFEWSALREHLSSRLPEYMIPTGHVLLQALPLTPNGKVDRRALPAAAPVARGAGEPYAEPQSETQQRIAGPWSELLDVERPGLDDDFFAQGGHSLLAVQLVSRIEDVLGRRIPLIELFQGPTIRQLAKLIEGRGSVPEPELPAISRRAPAELSPLSLDQEGLWFLDQLEPHSTRYNMGVAFEVGGALDTPALRASLAEVVRRHEALRTAFVEVDGEPMQQVLPADEFELEDVPVPPGEGAEEAARAAVQGLLGRPFDLGTGRVFRAGLVRLEASRHVLAIAMHHIVADGWSLDLLCRELGELYEAFSRGQASPLSELAVQYADYALWQRSWLRDVYLEQELGYWRGRLASVPTLQLPTDRPRPTVQRFSGAMESISLAPSLREKLAAVGREAGATLYMVLLAAFGELLHRYSGQDDIAVGTPVARRTRTEVEALVGMFVNTVVMRLDLSDTPSFHELVMRVRETALEAQEHAAVPFESIVRDLAPVRDLAHNPLFQVNFNYEKRSGTGLSLGRCAVSTFHRELALTHFDLDVYMIEQADGEISVGFVYDTDLFDAQTVHGLLVHYRRLLESAANAPQTPASRLEMLDAQERSQQLQDWNATASAYPREVTLHALFEAQAARTPDAIAVSGAGQALNYAELNARANAVARHLAGSGLGAGELVGVCLERSTDMLVSVLGVLKSGCAYVPLDPGYPAQRLDMMVSDSGMRALLTHTHLGQRIKAPELAVSYLDHWDWPAEATDASVGAGVEVSPTALAYVIYTSGSTGRPKGVEITHRSLVNFLWSMKDRPGQVASDVLLAVTTLSFDIAGLELYLPLLVGAQVVLADTEEAMNGEALGRKLAASGATVMQATPVTWRLLLDSGWQGTPGLKILCGGETLPRDLARRLLATGSTVWNLYGPTETTIWSTVEPVSESDGPVLIGCPIANTRAYVLNAAGEPVPRGVVGELYLAGDGVARGYRGRADLTAERFVPEPFVEGAGRMYRTGDLARYRSDGRLELLGRADFQVKVRGFRIELNEVESVLRTHPGVAQAVVLAQDDETGFQQLVAYLVPAAGNTFEWSTLREHLGSRLPEYMIPTGHVLLQSLPLTPNGKVDRRALPAAAPVARGAGEPYAEPQSETQQRIAGLWSELLDVERPSLDDDFFAQGGHSLLAVQLVSRIEDVLGRRIPLIELFQGPTIRQLAKLIEDYEKRQQVSYCQRLGGSGPREPFFAGGSHPRYADLLEETTRMRSAYRLDVYALQSARLLNGQALCHNIEEITGHMLKEVRAIQPRGPYFLGGACEGALVALEMARKLEADGEAVACLFLWTIPTQLSPKRKSSFWYSTVRRLVRHAQILLSKGSIRSFNLREWRALIKHEYMEYAIFGAIERYRPDGRINATTTMVWPSEATSHLEVLRDYWKKFTNDNLSVHIVKGEHASWLDESASELGDFLAERISSAASGSGQ